MQILFFSPLRSVDKYKNEQIMKHRKPWFPRPNLTCDPIDENDFERKIVWCNTREDLTNTLEVLSKGLKTFSSSAIVRQLT